MSERRGNQVWRDWLTLYGAMLGAQAISGVRSLAVAALLGPQQFGLWKSLQLALSYSAWSDLGALRGLGRQVPLLRGEGRMAEVEVVRRAAWTLLFVFTMVVAVALVAAGVWASDSLLGHGLIAVAPVVLTTRLLFYFFELANAEKAFGLKSRAVIILAVTDALLAPLASWWGGVWLFMWSVTVSNALVIAYLTMKLSFSWRLSWCPRDMLAVSSVGFPIAIAWFAFELLRTVDRFVIVTLIGTEAVGYYGLAMIVFEMSVMVPILFGQVMLPHVAEQFGREGDSTALFDQAEQVITTVNRFLPVLLAVGWLLLPAVTRVLLPAYMPGVGAARILLWATVFVTVHSIASAVLITMRYRALLILINGVTLIVGGLLCWGVVQAGGGITEVAAVMLMTYGLGAAAEFLATGLLCGRGSAFLLRRFVGAYVPAAAAFLAVVLLERLVRGQPLCLAVSAGLAGLAVLGTVALWQTNRVRNAPVQLKRGRYNSSSRENALVSVVLPVRNGANFVGVGIRSILAQTYAPLELIVVDDHSDDATPQILASINDPRVRVIRSDPGVGSTAARNMAIRASRGALIAAMDADDVAYPERIAKEAHFLQTHSDYGVVTCAFECVDSAAAVLDRVYPPCDDEVIRRLLIQDNLFAHSALMVRREAIESVGLYDESMRYSDDYDLYLRLAQHWRFACLPEVLQRLAFHSASMSATSGNWGWYYHLVAQLRAMSRGQYPLSAMRYLLRTVVSMMIPTAVKGWRRRRQGQRFSFYRDSLAKAIMDAQGRKIHQQ